MYIALKPCKFGAGREYLIGDTIPDEVVADSAAKRLISMGVIAEVNKAEAQTVVISDTTLSIMVKTDDGEAVLEPTDKGVQDIFTVLIGKAAEAEAVIKEMDDREALLLLSMADGRKSVSALASARAEELKGLSEEAGEQ